MIAVGKEYKRNCRDHFTAKRMSTIELLFANVACYYSTIIYTKYCSTRIFDGYLRYLTWKYK